MSEFSHKDASFRPQVSVSRETDVLMVSLIEELPLVFAKHIMTNRGHHVARLLCHHYDEPLLREIISLTRSQVTSIHGIGQKSLDNFCKELSRFGIIPHYSRVAVTADIEAQREVVSLVDLSALEFVLPFDIAKQVPSLIENLESIKIGGTIGAVLNLTKQQLLMFCGNNAEFAAAIVALFESFGFSFVQEK
jgi:hypothetical protein